MKVTVRSRSTFALSVLAVLCAALLVIPAFAQAIWSDYRVEDASAEPQTVPVTAYAGQSSNPQTITVSYYSDGPTVMVPQTVVVPAGQTSVTFNVAVGPTAVGDAVMFSFYGPTTNGGLDIYFD